VKEELDPAMPGETSGQFREQRRRRREGENSELQATHTRRSLRGAPLQRRSDVPNCSERKRQRIREPDPNDRPLKRLRDRRQVDIAHEPKEHATETVPRRRERRLCDHEQRASTTRSKASASTAEPRRWPCHRSDEDAMGPRLPPLARRRTSAENVGGQPTSGRGQPVVPREVRRLHTTSEGERQQRQQQQQQQPQKLQPASSRSRPLTVPLANRPRKRPLGEQEPDAQHRHHRRSAPQQQKQKQQQSQQHQQQHQQQQQQHQQEPQQRRQQQHQSQSMRGQKRPRSIRDKDTGGETNGSGIRPVIGKQEAKEERSKKKRRHFDEEACIFEEHAEDSDHWEMASRSSSGAASGGPPPEVAGRSRCVRGEGFLSRSRRAAPAPPRFGRNESADGGKRRRGRQAEHASAAVVGNPSKEELHRRQPQSAASGSTTKASSWEERQVRREAAARAALRHATGATASRRGSAGSSPDRRLRISGRPQRA